jgi:hypothetical protein
MSKRPFEDKDDKTEDDSPSAKRTRFDSPPPAPLVIHPASEYKSSGAIHLLRLYKIIGDLKVREDQQRYLEGKVEDDKKRLPGIESALWFLPKRGQEKELDAKRDELELKRFSILGTPAQLAANTLTLDRLKDEKRICIEQFQDHHAGRNLSHLANIVAVEHLLDVDYDARRELTYSMDSGRCVLPVFLYPPSEGMADALYDELNDLGNHLIQYCGAANPPLSAVKVVRLLDSIAIHPRWALFALDEE